MTDFKLSRGPKDTSVRKDEVLGLSKDEYEVIQKPKSRTKEVTDKIEAPDGKLPKGYCWVWNRLDRKLIRNLDNQEQVWEPYEFKVYPEDIARWLYSHSEITGGTGPEGNYGTVRCLALEGKKEWLKPLGKYKPAEFINRVADPNPIGKGTGGLKTQPKLMEIDNPI